MKMAVHNLDKTEWLPRREQEKSDYSISDLERKL